MFCCLRETDRSRGREANWLVKDCVVEVEGAASEEGWGVIRHCFGLIDADQLDALHHEHRLWGQPHEGWGFQLGQEGEDWVGACCAWVRLLGEEWRGKEQWWGQ